MPNISFGRIVVPVAGVPVQITSNLPASATVLIHALMVQPHPANTGRVYIGNKAGFSRNGDGQIAWLAPPSANSAPAFSETISYAENALEAKEFWVDVDNGGESVIASGLIT